MKFIFFFISPESLSLIIVYLVAKLEFKIHLRFKVTPRPTEKVNFLHRMTKFSYMDISKINALLANKITII